MAFWSYIHQCDVNQRIHWCLDYCRGYFTLSLFLPHIDRKVCLLIFVSSPVMFEGKVSWYSNSGEIEMVHWLATQSSVPLCTKTWVLFLSPLVVMPLPSMVPPEHLVEQSNGLPVQIYSERFLPTTSGALQVNNLHWPTISASTIPLANNLHLSTARNSSSYQNCIRLGRESRSSRNSRLTELSAHGHPAIFVLTPGMKYWWKKLINILSSISDFWDMENDPAIILVYTVGVLSHKIWRVYHAIVNAYGLSAS